MNSGTAAHSLKLQLLFRRQFVLETDSQFHVQPFYLSLVVEDLVELSQCLLLVHRYLFHGCVQRFHRILQLPLQLIEARGGLVDFSAHESFLVVSEGQFALMLHDHLWRKHRVTERVTRSTRRLWRFRLRGWLWRQFLGGHQHSAQQSRGDCQHNQTYFLFHKISSNNVEQAASLFGSYVLFERFHNPKAGWQPALQDLI
jgi:hypothetical protein